MKKKTQSEQELFMISWFPLSEVVPNNKEEAKMLTGYREVLKDMTLRSAIEALNCLEIGAPNDGHYYLFPCDNV